MTNGTARRIRGAMAPPQIRPSVLRKVIRSSGTDPALRKLLLRFVSMSAKRRVNMAHSISKRDGVAERFNKRRYAKHLARKCQRELLNRSHVPLPKQILAWNYRPNAVIESIWPERAKKWIPPYKRARESDTQIITISRLSFIEDPGGVLDVIREIAKAEATSLDVRVDFDFDYVEDLGPLLLLAEIWPSFAPVFTSGGNMHGPVQKVIEAVGLRHALRMGFPALDSLSDVWAMPAQRRRPTSSSASAHRYLDVQKHETVATRLCDEIDRWFDKAKTGSELNRSGRQNIAAMVGEMLDNAERHSSIKDKDGSWTIAAFMARRMVDGAERFVCHVAFVSLGDTIAESLAKTESQAMRRLIDGFLKKQKAAKAPQSPDTLITLAALQDGITRDEEAVERDSGGTGFMEFVDSVNILASSDQPDFKPQIAIISGTSCVTMRSPYIKGERAPQGGRRIFFNDTNSPDQPAGTQFVFDLPVKLPGTVVSAAFTLDPDFYRKVLNARNSTEGTDSGESSEP